MFEFFLISIVLMALFIIEKHNIKIPIISKHNESLTLIIIIAFFIIIMGGSSKNPDTVVYKNMYLMSSYTKNPGFGFLISMSKKIGVSIEIFRLIIAIIGIILINSVVKKYLSKRYRILFYLFYFIYPFFIDIVQIRNFLSMSIVIYALNTLIKGTLKSKFEYIFLILIAFSFQSMFILYLPLVFIDSLFNNNKFRYVIYLILFFSLILFSNKNILNSVIYLLSPFLKSNFQDITHYISQSTNFGGYVRWGISFLNIFLLKYSYKNLKSINTNEKYLAYTKHVCWCNEYTLIFLPLSLITLDFYRIQRNLQLMNYMIYIFELSNIFHTRKYRENLGFIILLIFILFISFIFLFVIDNSLSDVIIAIFNNNWILHRG